MKHLYLWMICLMISFFQVSNANAHDKVVVVPLMGSENAAASGTPAPVAKTGQTTSYATVDDGDLEKGVSWPSPRFTDNLDGTVTDHLTDLIWLKNANCFLYISWTDALSNSNGLSDGGCGLSDGSVAGDWRLPNVKELHSLIDFSQYNPALPIGHPFLYVTNNYYWSSTTSASATLMAFSVPMAAGNINFSGKTTTKLVWPVRGGQ